MSTDELRPGEAAQIFEVGFQAGYRQGLSDAGTGYDGIDPWLLDAARRLSKQRTATPASTSRITSTGRLLSAVTS